MTPAFFMMFFYVFFSSCQDARVKNYLADMLLMYLQKWWWILSVKINQLPKVASASSSSLRPLPFLISTIHRCHAHIPDRHLSTPIPPPAPSHFNTSTSRGPRSSIHTAVPSRSLAHPALIYCPLKQWTSPSLPPSFLPLLASPHHHSLRYPSIHQTE